MITWVMYQAIHPIQIHLDSIHMFCIPTTQRHELTLSVGVLRDEEKPDYDEERLTPHGLFFTIESVIICLQLESRPTNVAWCSQPLALQPSTTFNQRYKGLVFPGQKFLHVASSSSGKVEWHKDSPASSPKEFLWRPPHCHLSIRQGVYERGFATAGCAEVAL